MDPCLTPQLSRFQRVVLTLMEGLAFESKA